MIHEFINTCYNNNGDYMGIFNNLFMTIKEKITKDILKKKPQILMHTSTITPNEINAIRPSYNKSLNTNIVFATDNQKLATLYALQPFFSFKFGKNNKEIGVILLGSEHDLLTLDNKVAYTYFVDSNSFNPNVDIDGHYEHEWISFNEVPIKKEMDPKERTFKDVLMSGIQVFWVSNIQTLSEMDREMVGNNIITGDQKLEYLINQTNWKPDKVIYINRFRNICPVTQVNGQYVIDYNK